MCASMKPGTIVSPDSSRIFVSAPIRPFTDSSGPTCTNFPARTANAEAFGCFASTVKTFARRTTRSAGSAAVTEIAPKAGITTARETVAKPASELVFVVIVTSSLQVRHLAQHPFHRHHAEHQQE